MPDRIENNVETCPYDHGAMNLWLHQKPWDNGVTVTPGTWRVTCEWCGFWKRYQGDPRIIGYGAFDFQSRPWRNQVGP